MFVAASAMTAKQVTTDSLDDTCYSNSSLIAACQPSNNLEFHVQLLRTGGTAADKT
jgi:acyl-CoA thioesterase